MTKMNEVLKMLDWNNPQKIQNKGIKLASEILDLNILIQPNDELFNKNICDNCAIILRDKTDDEIQPYLNQLLEWLQDLNWPGAMIIKERLANYKNTKELISAINVCTDHAFAANDFIWLDNLNSILKNNSNDD